VRQFACQEFTVARQPIGSFDPRTSRRVDVTNLPVTRSNSTGYRIVIVTAIETANVC